MSENEFETGDAGALNTELVESSRMKPGSLIMMKDGKFPCRVTAFSTAKPGKHGSAKAMITAKDIFTDKLYEETFSTGDMIPRPIVEKIEAICVDVNEYGEVFLMMPDGEMKEDLDLPTEAHLIDVAKKIREILTSGKFQCLVTY